MTSQQIDKEADNIVWDFILSSSEGMDDALRKSYFSSHFYNIIDGLSGYEVAAIVARVVHILHLGGVRAGIFFDERTAECFVSYMSELAQQV